MRDRLRRQSQREQGRARKFYARRPAADHGGDFGKQVAERDIVAAEDIALADPARFQRRQMARRDIVDMNEIEAGVDIGGHAARAPPR